MRSPAEELLRQRPLAVDALKRADLPVEPGVYALYHTGRVVYVGESRRGLRSRLWGNHFRGNARASTLRNKTAKALGFEPVSERRYGSEAEAAISAKLRECDVRFLVVEPSAIPDTQAILISELDPPMNDHPGQTPRWRVDEVRDILGVSSRLAEVESETLATTRAGGISVEAILGIAGLRAEVEPSPMGLYRYVWRLSWDPDKNPLMVVGLMPSTADEEKADATVAKLAAIAARPHPEVGEAEGFGELVMMNMFARRPMPSHRRSALGLEFVDAVGDNDAWISREAQSVRARGGTVVAAWGGDGWSRHAKVLSLLHGAVWCFGMTQSPAPGAVGFPLSASRSRVTESAMLSLYLDRRAFRQLTSRAREEHSSLRRAR